MGNLEAVLALGAYAFNAYMRHLARNGVGVRGLKFAHGKVYEFPGMPTLYVSYHPSPRNTNTGKLTQQMLVGLFKRVRRDLGRPSS
jgi:uracil-DNA glycosylase